MSRKYKGETLPSVSGGFHDLNITAFYGGLPHDVAVEWLLILVQLGMLITVRHAAIVGKVKEAIKISTVIDVIIIDYI